MMAFRAHEQGGPEALRYEEAARPVAGNGEVVVEVHPAASPLVNCLVSARGIADLDAG
jgi:NADPH:quinone reductase-like Zn-dependent oxidoreductase